MTAPKVLISDALSEAAVQIFKDRGIDVDFQPNLGKDKDKLAEIIGNYDGLAIRSATKATAKILEKANRLKVIGRAGIGVDNVEIPAATAKGIIVMNTPFGNSITTAEHAITMMLSLAREIPAADASTQAGKWEKNRFMGVEITAKTLGVIGCGNIGSIVADRALGLKMKVIAFDPFLSPERAKDLGVEKVELEDIFKRADFITLHTPLTDKTKNIIDAAAIAKMKKGVRIINCARGGLVDENALAEALKSGHVAGAAFDVFSEEPATKNVLFGLPNVICTPHLGASTTEAQENVALQVAEQMSDYLLTGAITNAINFPSITAEEAPKLKPFIELAEKLGSFAGQLTETGITKVTITYEGEVAEMKIKALTSAVLSGLLRPMLGDINVVSAPVIAKERGMVVDEVVRAAESDYESLITLTVTTEKQERSVSGTVYADGKPRLVDIKGIRVDAEFGASMIYVTNEDKPGFIGKFASLLGDAKVNIATFNLGRHTEGGDAIALVTIDGPAPAEVLEKVQALPQVKQVKALTF
ncbi:phosphoglycerate dehydrogenase [Rhodopseudomonas palustris]|uniref:D-3-phosphoglycerate dehydrogenase n=1 Tax=Rhodopseudomonas palustris TaxID=1076 RepID=A0AAX3DWL1_RHOPL|nr:phosphoglycerate dehydrogenase [Rhodopseudomonas palustris]AVT83164.1 3-phosphoglycerate dehydrogenase [Rhodopseudomonas palustris]UYO39204.1 phosphoglycerate dehydrogenase [Rhodopseudomonas palustris]UYO43925.1 phosphoglycerate dehydrogenase [Rhodopseudomonas palustris]UYO53294.1 phosphoglycerate dehydrogenase [Rhodopseudomonas palustris]